MSMTREERETKDYIQSKLSEEGYPTYASIFNDFDLNITRDPYTVGFMEPNKGRIVLNVGLDESQVSTIIRHEILHQYLEHEKRLLKKLCKEHNLDYDKVDNNSLEDIRRKLYSNDLFNIAADYEISNRGYTEKDKDNVRNILLNGQVLKGLVTEDDHPDWVDLSVEEMYDKLREEREKEEQDISQDMQDQQQSSNQQDSSSSSQQDSSTSQQQSDSNSSSQQNQSSSSSSSKSSSSQSQSRSQNSENNSSANIEDSIKEAAQKAAKDIMDSIKNGMSVEDAIKKIMSDAVKEFSKGAIPDDIIDELIDDIIDNKMNPEEAVKKAMDKISKEQDQDSDSSEDADSQDQSGGSGSSDSSSGSKNSKPNTRPQIGKKGDENTLAREDAEREEQVEKESEEYGDQRESDLDKEERLKRIERAFNDSETLRQAGEESAEKIKKERAARAAKDAKKYRNSPIKKFRDNLNRFIKNEVGKERVRTWKRTDPRYGTGPIIRKGKARVSSGHIPLINVYFDRSGSWDSAKTKVGQDAIGTLNNYVKQGQIKINLYYFNNEVHSEDPGGRGGTYGTPIIEHIKQTKPDNVIIMTDSDIRDINESITVPGAVWLLFKGGQSQNLIDHIHGAKQTNIYNLD